MLVPDLADQRARTEEPWRSNNIRTARTAQTTKRRAPDGAKHAAAAIEREVRRQALAHSQWMDAYDKVN